MDNEIVLLVCLTPEENEYIRLLVSSFEIETKHSDTCQLESASPSLAEMNICLVIFRVDDQLDNQHRQPEQEIRQLRNMLSPGIPILLLVPPHLSSNIKDYLRAGADDYWLLPIDETAFSARFYVLLEWGQVIAHTRPVQSGRVSEEPESSSLIQRILNRLQNGLNFFSPSAMIQSRKFLIVRKWKQISKLGSGGFGEVWLVQEHGKKNMAVAKIPHSAKMNLRSLRSAAILKRLILHPNVVQLIEVIKEEGKVILIQEYVAGDTMQSLLESGMSAIKKENIFLQLLDVVSYAHQHKIMHRDIKPENIIITDSGNLKLLDFGIAKELSRESIISKTVVGTRPFMAPEQIMGKSCLASDVWALGVIFYLLATRCLPFFNENEKYLMDMILESAVTPPRQLNPAMPEKLEPIILKTLEKDTKNRYATAEELRTDLLRVFPDFGGGDVLLRN